MNQEAFFFNLVAYSLIVIAVLLVLGTALLFLRDAVQQEPRFKKVLRWLGFSFALGVLCVVLFFSTQITALYLAGAVLAGVPAVIVLTVVYGLLKEAAGSGAGVSMIILGSLIGAVMGIALLVLKSGLERSL